MTNRPYNTSTSNETIHEELAAACGGTLSPYLKGVFDIVLSSQPPPGDLPSMNGKQMGAHWQRISRLATELIEAVEGPKGRKLAVNYTLRARIAALSKIDQKRPLGCDISDTPLWWDAVKNLLALIAENAASEAARQREESARRGQGVSASVNVTDDLLAMMYALAHQEALERGDRPPIGYQSFRRSVAKHLPPHLLSNLTPEAFAQRPKRQLRRRKHTIE